MGPWTFRQINNVLDRFNFHNTSERNTYCLGKVETPSADQRALIWWLCNMQFEIWNPECGAEALGLLFPKPAGPKNYDHSDLDSFNHEYPPGDNVSRTKNHLPCLKTDGSVWTALFWIRTAKGRPMRFCHSKVHRPASGNPSENCMRLHRD